MTRNQNYVFAASQGSHVFTVVDRTVNGSYALGLPGVYRVSVNPGGSMAIAFVAELELCLLPGEAYGCADDDYSGGPGTWPKAAVDCEPQNAPDGVFSRCRARTTWTRPAITTGRRWSFDRPIKAVFSADGGTAYVLNCGPECGGPRVDYADARGSDDFCGRAGGRDFCRPMPRYRGGDIGDSGRARAMRWSIRPRCM